MPLPHSGCACVTLPLIPTTPAIGLLQPTAAHNVGDGWTQTACGFMLPGTRTLLSDEFASNIGVSLVPQPLMNA